MICHAGQARFRYLDALHMQFYGISGTLLLAPEDSSHFFKFNYMSRYIIKIVYFAKDSYHFIKFYYMSRYLIKIIYFAENNSHFFKFNYMSRHIIKIVHCGENIFYFI